MGVQLSFDERNGWVLQFGGALKTQAEVDVFIRQIEKLKEFLPFAANPPEDTSE